jgi:hypothetical protein
VNAWNPPTPESRPDLPAFQQGTLSSDQGY